MFYYNDVGFLAKADRISGLNILSEFVSCDCY